MKLKSWTLLFVWRQNWQTEWQPRLSNWIWQRYDSQHGKGTILVNIWGGHILLDKQKNFQNLAANQWLLKAWQAQTCPNKPCCTRLYSGCLKSRPVHFLDTSFASGLQSNPDGQSVQNLKTSTGLDHFLYKEKDDFYCKQLSLLVRISDNSSIQFQTVFVSESRNGVSPDFGAFQISDTRCIFIEKH